MDRLVRIKDIIGKVETNNFIIKEQDNLLGDVWDLGSGAVKGLWDAASGALKDGVPYITDKLSGDKLLNNQAFSGKLDVVVTSAAKLFNDSINGTLDSKTDLYNTLVILDNLYRGAISGSIKDKKGNGFKVWEVFESFTIALYYEFRGQKFDYYKMWTNFIEKDDIDNASDDVIDKIEGKIRYEVTLGDLGQKVKKFLSDFFESGQSFSAIWNNDRLDGEWKVGEIKYYLDQVDVSEYKKQGRILTKMESKLRTKLPCYSSIKMMFTKQSSGTEVAVHESNGGFMLVFYFDKSDKLNVNVYHETKGFDTPVATSNDITCKDAGMSSSTVNFGGINESLLSEQAQKEYMFLGDIAIKFKPEDWDSMLSHTNYKKSGTPQDNTQQNSSQDNTQQKSDSGKDEPKTSTVMTKTKVDELIDLLISKGVQEVIAKDPKRRASMGSVAVGALLGKNISDDEYVKNESDIYAEKFIESINKGITTFKSNQTNHEIKAKEEEKVVRVISNISNPTPIEVKKIEEIGDDAVAKSNNELSFNKNRIKSVRITSDENQVVYISKDDITDMISDIEGQLEQVFGGDWKLEQSKNRFMSSNKIFIFSKKQ